MFIQIFYALVQSSILLLVLPLAMNYCSTHARSLTTTSHSAAADFGSWPLTKGAGIDNKLSIIILTTTQGASANHHTMDDESLSYNSNASVSQGNGTFVSRIDEIVTTTLSLESDTPRTGIKAWSETITNVIIMALLGGVIVKYLKVGKVVRELSTAAHEALVEARKKRKAERNSLQANLLTPSPKLKRPQTLSLLPPTPQHKSTRRDQTDNSDCDDEITIDSINNILWGRTVNKHSLQTSVQVHRHCYSALEVRRQPPDNYVQRISRRHSFDALDSARSKQSYAVSNEDCRSIACSPKSAYDQLDVDTLQVEVEKGLDMSDSDDDDSTALLTHSEQQHMLLQQCENLSTGFEINSS